ncbi:hypothetical protein BSK63_02625 [Paenibacillus odorifer]|nr:hypothetical protein BSK63_02625 [Paenibacillus odorifer]OME41150.1 hypothetical protein BSK46_05235 [Paenibacillus odorifer]
MFGVVVIFHFLLRRNVGINLINEKKRFFLKFNFLTYSLMLKKKFVNNGTCGIIDKPFKKFLRKIGNIFIPLIPAFVGAGLIAGKYDFAN